ncbi:Uncharacterised protein [uncultured archaeon]|nr:Uncharacterised protein [uncultured archaeon]
MNEPFFVILNSVAAITIIISNVLSLRLLEGISRELKGLKTIDVMWDYFIIMTGLFIVFGITRAAGTIVTVVSYDIQPVFDALISVILIFFSVFAVLLSRSIEEITE